MPFYEYKCKECDDLTQASRPITSRDDLMLCQECNVPMERHWSGFSIGRISKSDNSSKNPSGQKTILTANNSNGEAIRVEAGNSTVSGNTIENYETGISLDEGINVEMNNNKFINVRNPIEVKKN